MNVPFMDDLTLLHPLQGLVALGLLVLLAIFVIVMSKRKPVIRERHTYFPEEVLKLNSARTKQLLVAVPVVLLLIALVIGTTQPATALATAKEEAHMCLILDKSLSMAASDVSPTRIDAMKQAASSTIRQAPADLKILVIAFAGADQIEIVIEPSLNRDEALERIENLQMADGTAIGEGIFTAIDVLSSLEDSPLRSAEELSEGDEPPVACVLLSDGTSVDGRPPFEAAQAAAELDIPIYTVAFGTDEGLAPVRDLLISVKPDRQTLQQIAETTGGQYFEAVSSDELEEIFSNISTKVATETEYQILISSISAWFLLTLFVAFIVMRTGWFHRIN